MSSANPQSKKSNISDPQMPKDAAQQTTETLDKTPPHGMKGDLTATAAVTPQMMLLGAGVILLIACLVTMILWLVAWRRKRARQRLEQNTYVPSPTAWGVLRDAIDRIRIPGRSGDEFASEGRVDQVEWNHFSSEVSLCLRRGLEIRTGYTFAESTTEEILSLLKSRSMDLVALSEFELRQTLSRLDEIRFGGQDISVSEAIGILQALKNWCDRLEKGTPVSTEPGAIESAKGGLRVFNS